MSERTLKRHVVVSQTLTLCWSLPFTSLLPNTENMLTLSVLTRLLVAEFGEQIDSPVSNTDHLIL